MKVAILFFFALFSALNALAVNKNQPHVLATDNPPCATNASTAFVDVILVIDTSINMGSSNLRKIGNTVSLILSKFTIGNMVDIRQGYRNTRVAVVTYDATAKIVANYTDINSISDLTNVLNGVSASNSQQANLYE
uniref:VWFA domain-containing protein n=1 Tax=Acrobeloides nanus TaxID=290746 RepID=A0A914D495_9BILA